jgi:hypothetical protein
VAVTVWILAFAGIVGVALLGRLSGPADATDGVPIALDAAPGAESLASPRSVSGASVQPGADPARADGSAGPDALIVVVSPATGEPTITSGELIVQGSVRPDTHSLRVIVEALGKPLDAQTVQPGRVVVDGFATVQHARFLVRIQLPDPRPIGPMVLEVSAFDRDGKQLAVVRRPFQLGRVDRPTLGDDGLLGGIVFPGG